MEEAGRDGLLAEQLFAAVRAERAEGIIYEDNMEMTEEQILDEDIEIITEKKVCVFWSMKGSGRTDVVASVKNPYDKTSKNYDSCACPDNKSDAALAMCDFNVVNQGDAEIYCPFYEAEQDVVLFETDKGKVCTNRILSFEEMTMERTFHVQYPDGNVEPVETAAAGFEKIQS